jgi:Holliday junction resolvase RusA-like endonuclease
MPKLPNSFTFKVYGAPAPQGSMAVRRGKYAIACNQKKLYSWRHDVATQALKYVPEWWNKELPVSLRCEFVFARPKYHFSTAKGKTHQTLPSAPCHHIVPPDNDKLVRAIGDALSVTQAVLRDDSLIVLIHSLKRYARHDEPIATTITVTALDT